MNKIEQIKKILRSVGEMTDKAEQIAALYSQEPQKVCPEFTDNPNNRIAPFSQSLSQSVSTSTEGMELNNKLREQFATLIWHYWEQHFAYPKSAHLYGCVDELFKLLKSLPTEQAVK